jgi:prepilin-type N-terminal cleavage/methylation domain-containing protein
LKRLFANLSDEAGFTLVELLVVMLMLTILIAIAVPAFFGQSDKARDAEAKQALGAARTAIELIEREQSSYAGITAADLEEQEPTLVDVTLEEPITTNNTYTLQVVASSGTTFSVSRVAGGVLDFDCAPRTTGGCPLDGDWAG